MTNLATPTTLRIPRGLWADLEESIIQQDRQFLTEVARSLGLPVAEVLRKVLGTGAPQLVQVLASTVDADRCPWWDRIGEGLWRPCCRQRMSGSQPCQIHASQSSSSPSSRRLGVDTHITNMPSLTPISYDGIIYWVSDDPDACVFREDGAIAHDIEFRKVVHRGKTIYAAVKT